MTRALNRLLLLTGLVLLSVGLFLDWSRLLRIAGLPVEQLQNVWVRGELVTLRGVCIVTGTLLLMAVTALRVSPLVVARLSEASIDLTAVAKRAPVFIPLALTVLVLMKTVLQFGLYLSGYTVYGADDFTRTFSADYWLYHRHFDFRGQGWLGFVGSVWLPFPDYLFGLGLMVHRDLFLTPKIVNLFISGIGVIAAYFLARELFGRTAGLLTAGLVAFQPWHVWLGISGMTSDLPSLVLVTVFALFMYRWLQTDRRRALLTAAGALAVANGFRHESWFFSAVFSLFLVLVAISRWRQGRLTGQWLIVAICALAMINVIPILWTALSHYVAGDWMPHFSWTQWRPQAGVGPETRPDLNSPGMGSMSIPLLALGAFPFELALSIAGIVLLLRSDKRLSLRLYLVVLALAFSLFAIVFKGQLAASLVFARYLLPFIALLLPFAGGFLARLLKTPEPRRTAAVVAAAVMVLTIGTFDVLRAFNYPAQFPRDAIYVGWTLRGLQETGTIPASARILIERAEDWGDLGIVALANKPERFVVLNELSYQQTALSKRAANRPTPRPLRSDEGVRGSICETGFHVDDCRNSVLQEGFTLVILSSPTRVMSFRETFEAPSWNIGRYHIFELKPGASTEDPAQDRPVKQTEIAEATAQEEQTFRKKINLVSKPDMRTPNPLGWEEYDGSPYTKERGYGWLAPPAGFVAGGGSEDLTIELPEGVTSPRKMGRLELADWHGAHRENQLLVFRIDLASGWYRVGCASSALIVLPVVDQITFKCRAHDSVFAGPSYGAPLKARGVELIEGANIVEVTDDHLRIVVGDPAYAGWTWSYEGAWYRGWRRWWGTWGDQRYAETWYQKLTRTIDPGFHTLRFSALDIERVSPPVDVPAPVFRDFFNRDDSHDVNSGVTGTDRWVSVSLHPAMPAGVTTELSKTSLALTASGEGKGTIGVLQMKTSPADGIIRYSTRVSLFTGEGSKVRSGAQEAGLLILAEGSPTDFSSTFVGVALDQGLRTPSGWVRYRVGNGRDGYRTSVDIAETSLPFHVTEGEHQLVVDHNIKENLLERIQINGNDITGLISPGDRKQRVSRGAFGIRAFMDPLSSGVRLKQFYWYYRVEDLARTLSRPRDMP